MACAVAAAAYPLLANRERPTSRRSESDLDDLPIWNVVRPGMFMFLDFLLAR